MSKLIYNSRIDVDFDEVDEITLKMPSGKEVPFRKVKHGKWKDGSRNGYNGTFWYIYCSECLYERDDDNPDNNTPYCPHCGADMRGETE